VIGSRRNHHAQIILGDRNRLRAGRAELIEQDFRRCDAGLVVGQKIFRANDTIGTDQVVGGKWNPIERMARGNIGIENAERLDDGAALVGEAWIAEMLRVGKAAKDLLRIVTDRGDLYPMGLEALARLFQLNELAAAVGSPIGTAGEDQQEAIGARELAKGLRIAVLVGQREVGNLVAYVEAAGGAIILRLDEFLEFRGRNLLAAEHLAHDLVKNVGFAGFGLRHNIQIASTGFRLCPQKTTGKSLKNKHQESRYDYAK
jgi:hypothetical protein